MVAPAMPSVASSGTGMVVVPVLKAKFKKPVHGLASAKEST